KEHVHLIDLGVSPHELLQLFRSEYGLDDSQGCGFSGGYLTHLLTDRLWWQTIITPFRQRFPSTFPEKEFRSLYYRDTDRIDLDLYRQAAWRPQAWSSLETAAAADFAPFLTAAEILQWRDRTLRWYDDPVHDCAAEPVYISLSDTQAFIGRAGLEIAELYSGFSSYPKIADFS
ncbi:MAG TPA: hypothetical protein VMT91_13315, partial [Anaerolineales bacterium]|nr:hypothetical protein [Anaerolineales bacterium]